METREDWRKASERLYSSEHSVAHLLTQRNRRMADGRDPASGVGASLHGPHSPG